MTIDKNINTILGCNSIYEDSDIVLFGVPYDGTTSFRPGARFGPCAIRNESQVMEAYSPYQDRDLENINVMDSGDLELPLGGPEQVLDIISDFVERLLLDNKRPGMIGGESLVTLGAVRTLLWKYNDLRIVNLSARANLHDEYMGQALSHATVMRRCHDMLGDGRIYQLGVRSGIRDEFRFAKDHLYQQTFNFSGIKDVVASLQGKPIYLSVSLDVLDPSCFPGTSIPEPGGVSFNALMLALHELSSLNIVGFDIVELVPSCDIGDISAVMAYKVLREVLLFISTNRVRTIKVRSSESDD